MKKIITYLYLDESGGMKLRKSSYKLDDGEICVKITLKVPSSFYRKRTVESKLTVDIPDTFEEVKLETEANPL